MLSVKRLTANKTKINCKFSNLDRFKKLNIKKITPLVFLSFCYLHRRTTHTQYVLGPRLHNIYPLFNQASSIVYFFA